MTADPMTAARLEYARGQEAFERGEYRQAVSYLAEAVQLAQAATPLGGEIQTWLVNAYSAVGHQQEAEGPLSGPESPPRTWRCASRVIICSIFSRLPACNDRLAG
jgi:lipopolysaccharide biosynthesis regulator YciM